MIGLKWLSEISGLTWLRIAVVLVLVGILSEFIALLDLTPATFLLFAFIGIPCMGLGMLIYLVHVVRQLKNKDAL